MSNPSPERHAGVGFSTPLPESKLGTCHKKALRAVGIVSADHYRGTADFTPKAFASFGTARGDVEAEWTAALTRAGMAKEVNEPFVARLKARWLSDGLEWREVLQEVLKDLPVSQKEFYLLGWASDPTEYVGYSVTITRESITAYVRERISTPKSPEDVAFAENAKETESMSGPKP